MKKCSALLLPFLILCFLFSSCKSVNNKDEWTFVSDSVFWNINSNHSLPEYTTTLNTHIRGKDIFILKSTSQEIYTLDCISGIESVFDLSECASEFDSKSIDFFDIDDEYNYIIAGIVGNEYVVKVIDSSKAIIKQFSFPYGSINRAYVNKILVFDNKMYILADQHLFFINESGTIQKLSDDIFTELFFVNGKIFAFFPVKANCLYEVTDNKIICRIDTIPQNCGTIKYAISDSVFLTANTEGIFFIDTENYTVLEKCNYLRNGINSIEIADTSFYNDNIILLSISDGKWRALLLSAEPENQNKKKELTLLTLQDYTAVQSAMNFNNTNSDYSVQIINFYNIYPDFNSDDPMSQLKLSLYLTDNNSIDLVDISLLSDWRDYAKKGFFYPLNDFISDDSSIRETDYFQNIFDGAKINGAIYFIPYSFSFRSLYGLTEYVGTSEIWEFEDFIDTIENYKDAPFMNATPEEALMLLTDYYFEHFVDYEKRKADFDTSDFYRLLTICDTVERIPNTENPWSFEVLSESGAIIDFAYLFGPEMVRAWGISGSDPICTLKGFPSEKEDCLYEATFSRHTAFAIPLSSENKEGAWQFIEYLHSNYDEIQFLTDIPAKKEWAEIRTKNVVPSLLVGKDKLLEEEIAKWNEILPLAYIRDFDQSEIINIVNEEAAAFFAGVKTAEETAYIIQQRVQLYLNEL